MMFTSPDTLIPHPYNPLDWNRYLYGRANPIRYSDPTGHAVADDTQGGCGLPTCIVSDNKPPSTDTPNSLSEILSEDIDPPFDTTLGGNIKDPRIETEDRDERPSVFALVAIGVPLTVAITLVEAGLTYAEVEIAIATLVQPELAPLTVPLEFVLTGCSLALIDLDVAYWSYTYRIAFTPESEPVRFEILPPWGFGE